MMTEWYAFLSKKAWNIAKNGLYLDFENSGTKSFRKLLYYNSSACVQASAHISYSFSELLYFDRARALKFQVS